MDGWIDGSMDGSMDEWIDGSMDGSMDGSIDGWMDDRCGWVSGEMDITYTYIFNQFQCLVLSE